jgi:tRNA G18 (ribose-2'-O)-methylase SpoU
MKRVTTRNATFQQWEALLTNRAKRRRAGEFLVQGVRPLTIAVERGWDLHALLCCEGRQLSAWARSVLERVGAERFAVSADLMHELGGKQEGVPELLAVAAMPKDDLSRVAPSSGALLVVLDRPEAPGNVGAVVRSADAFGASGVIVSGHSADPYDPKAVRASTGSIFALPVVRVPSHKEVLDWAKGAHDAGVEVEVVGADENAERVLAGEDLTGPRVLVIGNEGHGLSEAWRAACDRTVRIPIGGSASSLNAAAAATVMLYEAARQRRAVSRPL